MFVDELTIEASAGDGGDGVVRWLHLLGKEYSGPAGGDGGRGGDVILHAVRDISLLARYRNEKVFRADDGEDGGSDSRHGAGGKDCVIDVPVGAVITHTQTGRTYELLQEGQRECILKGGAGGYGNEHYKRSTNGTPYESSPGGDGETGTFYIELKLIADAGFVGLPNAGKSSLLNSLTRASSKVGAYPFTTLSPHLGVLYGYVLADIPGLIEGASSGKGLGQMFLRHVTRTRLLLHCVSLESENPRDDYETIRKELAAYGHGLADKREVVVLTKADTVDAARLSEVQALFKGVGVEVLTVSIIDDDLLKSFQDRLVALLREGEDSATIAA